MNKRIATVLLRRVLFPRRRELTVPEALIRASEKRPLDRDPQERCSPNGHLIDVNKRFACARPGRLSVQAHGSY